MNLPSSWLFARSERRQPPTRPRRNTSIGGLSFALEIDGENVAMRISEEALRRCFGAAGCRSTWLAAYRKHAELIDARAIALHVSNPLGSVYLVPADFEKKPALMPVVA